MKDWALTATPPEGADVFVLTVDQRHSRRNSDRVDDLLGWLRSQPGVLRGFERTAGDEVQGVMDDDAAVVDLVLGLVRRGEWSIGIGAGPVNEPLPASTRAGSGPAFELARKAVERAKSSPQLLAVGSPNPYRATAAQAALDLLASVVQRRTEPGWEAVDLISAGTTQTEVAERLGITKQAVSQRLRAATWAPEVAGRVLAAQLLAAADAPKETSAQRPAHEGSHP
jgi:Winged helix-turn-helix DNA-binding